VDAQEKAALLAEIDAEGGKVKLVARRHRIAESVLYNWRAARKAASVMMPSSVGRPSSRWACLADPRLTNQRYWRVRMPAMLASR
jgi:transposase-like protein